MAVEGAEYRCFVGGLAWAIDERNLEVAFRPFGEILDAKIINDRETGRSRGFGFVTFSSEQSMRDAIDGMNGRELGGRCITVNEARPRHSGGRGGYGQRHEGDGGSGGYGQHRNRGNSDRRGPRPVSNPGNADDIFAQFFGAERPGQHSNEGGSGGNSDRRGQRPVSNPGNADDIFAQFFGAERPGQHSNEGGSGGNSDRRGQRPVSNPGNADDIFAQYFGAERPGQHSNEGGSGGNSDRRGSRTGMVGDDIFGHFRGYDGTFGHFPGFESTWADPCQKRSFPGEASMHASQRLAKAAPIEHQLACNLADLYKGTTKKMKISRELSDSSGRRSVREEILTIEIKPGWKKGTKITFPEKGNEAPLVIPADIVFIIDEKPHDQFTREGNDLVMTQKISLAEDWNRYTVHVTTLDGRNLAIPIKSVKPGYEEVVPGEGMPIPKDPSKKGNLRIKFNIKFPSGEESGN